MSAISSKQYENRGWKLKPSKCEFHQSETEYLGFIIGQEGVKTDPVKIQAIWDWTTPKKIKEIQCCLGFCNFYRRFIEGFSRTAKPLYAKTKKECIGKGEMERQGTTSIQQIKDKTHHSTSTGLLRPPCTDQNLKNRRLKIPLLRYTVTTMPGRKMETSGVPIQDNIRSRMQLRYTRQGTTGNSSGVPRMEKIHKRKSKTDTGPHRPQKLSHLHDDEGTQWTTSAMDARIKPIQLQNWIPTRKGGRKARRPHKKGRRPTHGLR